MRRVVASRHLSPFAKSQMPSLRRASATGYRSRRKEMCMPAGTRLRVRYLLALWLFLLSGVAFLDRTNISIAGLQISSEYGLGNQRLGWISSAFLLGYAGFQLPAGWMAARFGPRLLLTGGALWWGTATALTAVLPSGMAHAVALLIAIRFLLGAGESVMYPAANQFVARWVPMSERGVTNGLIFAGVGAGSGLTRSGSARSRVRPWAASGGS